MIEVRGLTKVYDGRTVVDSVSFSLAPGTVTAFLGPNGAGKSTTLRGICGLTPMSSGSATVMGRRFQDWQSPSHVAGVCLDASAVHPGRSGRGHLGQLARLAGVPVSRVDGLLATVGLADAARRPIGRYSLGMRQRLGLAAALLADPPILILDEPINGLDPDGIREIRTLLRGHAARGGTVLLSSHVLTEVDQTADRLVVIGNGRVVADGPLRALLTAERCRVRSDDPAALRALLGGARIRHEVGPDGSTLAHASLHDVSELMFAARLPVRLLAPEDRGLEELFFSLTATEGGR